MEPGEIYESRVEELKRKERALLRTSGCYVDEGKCNTTLLARPRGHKPSAFPEKFYKSSVFSKVTDMHLGMTFKAVFFSFLVF